MNGLLNHQTPCSLRGKLNFITEMKVLKFGGTSVGSVKSILSLKNIVEKEARQEPVIVVVSALGGITDKLLNTAQLALNGDQNWRMEFDEMVDRHHKMIDAIISNPTSRSEEHTSELQSRQYLVC